MKMADRFASRRYSLKNKLGDRIIKQLLNSVIAKYCQLRQIIDLRDTDKSRYFAQPRPTIANYLPMLPVSVEFIYLQYQCERKSSDGCGTEP